MIVDGSMVRIVNHHQRPDWFSPWKHFAVTESSGSGFIIAGGLVLTNAHVVADARLLVVFFHGDPTPYEAEVVAVGHDCDLALLRPHDPRPLTARRPLEFAGLPQLRSTVETYGYPAGGRQLSSTRGVVSRIEAQQYSHPANEVLLSVQTDAAINPGNSGGPVMQDGKVVGVAFQASSRLQNVGYFIPSEVVRHFWFDAKSPPYQGFPFLGVRLQRLENPAARRAAGIRDEETGALVDLVHPDSSAEGHLEVGDVLLEMDGQPVANDASVMLPPDALTPNPPELRVDLTVLVDRHQIGETLALKVLRNGERIPLSVPLQRWAPNPRYGNQYDRRPRYFVYGGLVFLPLDREMLKTFGEDWGRRADKVLLDEHLLRPYREPGQWFGERVVLMRRLAHRVNVGFSPYRNTVVDKVNHRRIGKLEDLVQAFEEHDGPYHVIEFWHGRIAVLDREATEVANEDILRQYAVQRDRQLQ